MAELNEDCLENIFGYLTPVEWVQISQVCRFWRTIILRKWNKTTKFTYADSGKSSRYFPGKSPVIIPDQDAKKIALYAAKFCNDLTLKVLRNVKDVVFSFGSFVYKVEGFNIDETVQLWAANATELTRIEFDDPPKMEVLKPLFKRNKIKRCRIKKNNNFWKHVSTYGMKSLAVRFVDPDDNIKSFRGHFRNLRRLELWIISVINDENFQRLLSRILPYVPGIRALTVIIDVFYMDKLDLRDIVKLSHLEELTYILAFRYTKESEYGEDFPKFDINLGTVCPKLRVVELGRFYVTDCALNSLLSLPNLEKLDLRTADVKFSFVKPLPVMENLTELKIFFHDSTTVNMADLCNAVKKMPKLLKLRVAILTLEQLLMLAHEAIMAATSQEKSVVVEIGRLCNPPLVKIESKNVTEQNIVQTLRMEMKDYCEKSYLEILEFVQNNLIGYRAVLLEDK